MPSAHSRVGPSSVHRVILCPGSVAMCDKAPEREATIYSAEGTVAHHVRELSSLIDQPRARGSSRTDADTGGFDSDDDDDDDDDDDTSEWGGEWRVTLDELLEFGEKLKTAFDLAESPDAWLRAGQKQCQFCPAKGYCPEYARWSLVLLDLELADLDPSVITLKNKDDFTEQQRTNVALNMGRITAWTKAVYGSVLNDAVMGRPTPGAKCVIGKEGPRKWADEKKAESFVRYSLTKADAYTEPALISPAQFEKQKKKVSPEERAKVADHVTRSPGKPALVGFNDKRAGYNMADMFDDD